MAELDFVKDILENNVKARNSNGELIADALVGKGLTTIINGKEYVSLDIIKQVGGEFETFTRAGREVRRFNPKLRPNAHIETYRKEKEDTKGQFIYSDLY